jgi:hypothetical protein
MPIQSAEVNMGEHNNCETCKFFKKDKLECRKHPPVPMLDAKLTVSSSSEEYYYSSHFPCVGLYDWCGDYKYIKEVIHV